MREASPPHGTLKVESSLRSALAQVSVIALTVAGFIVFLPAGILLALRFSEIEAAEKATYLVLLAIWILGLTRFAIFKRSHIQTAATLALLASPLLMVQTSSAPWLPVPFIAFAVTFGAAFSFRPQMAIPIIALTALLNWLVVLNPAPSVILSASEPLDGFIGPLFILVVGPALSILSRTWFVAAKRTDASREQIETVVLESYLALQIQSAQSMVDRRIHETVLNTLNGIASAPPAADRRSIEAACQHDLDQLELGSRVQTPQFISMLVADAITASRIGRLQPDVLLGDDIELSPQIAGAIRDALVEALRNVERHSGATATTIITTQNGGELSIRIHDNGSGISTKGLEQFGVRNTIKASMAALGGGATVTSPASGGTTVTLSIPLTEAHVLQMPSEPSLEAVTRSWLARLCIISPSIFGLLTVWDLTSNLNPSTLPLIAFLVFFAFNFALAIFWGTDHRVFLAVATFATAALALLATYVSLTGCSSSSAVHWLINAITGGIVLTIFALATNPLRISVLPALTILGLFLIWGLPNDCRGVPVMSIFVTVAYVIGGMYTARSLFEKFDAKRADAQELWARATEQQTEIARQAAISESWSRVSSTAKSFLADIASGVVDPLTQASRARAGAEESRIRVNLGHADALASGMWESVQGMVVAAGLAQISVNAVVLSAGSRRDPLPSAIGAALESTALAYPNQEITVRLFTDEDAEELLVTAFGDEALPIWVPGELTGFTSTELQFADCQVLVALDTDDEGVSIVINIRRPLNQPTSSQAV